MCTAPQKILFFWEYDLIFAVTGNMYVDFMGTIVGLKKGGWTDETWFYSFQRRQEVLYAFSSALTLSSAKAPWVSFKTAETGLRRHSCTVKLLSSAMLPSLWFGMLPLLLLSAIRGCTLNNFLVSGLLRLLISCCLIIGHLLESVTVVGRLWKLVLIEQSK